MNIYSTLPQRHAKTSIRPYRIISLTLVLTAIFGASPLWGQAPEGSIQPGDEKLYSARNAENMRASQQIKKEINKDITGIDFDYNHIIFDGQSLSVGADSKIAISMTQEHGNVMIGNKVAYDSTRAKIFSPLTGLGANDEHPIVGAVNLFKALYEKQLNQKGNRVFIGSSCGSSGKAIEQLSKGAYINLWERVEGSMAAAKEISSKENKSYGIAALCWVQGETNYSPSGDFAATKEGYKEKLKQFRDDFLKTGMGISNQPNIPAFVTYQTSGAYTNDTNGLAIGMAQWELTQEVPGCYLATPSYPFTDYGGHLTANGYRWMGAQFGKVLDKVMVRREKWKPLSPIKAKREGRTLSIDFHVPEPPLVFDSPYIGRNKPELAKNKGFNVYDGNAEVRISSIRIVADTIVEIVCERDFVGDVYVRYASKLFFDGNGYLRDSDPAVSEDTYVFDPNCQQQRPDENIPDLVNKPYPLYNWCIAFNLKVE
ncbi:MAG: hypothetical protein ACFUZC_10370 [Chthoniobacteraceae bacterium]